jgi:hypothetical protein
MKTAWHGVHLIVTYKAINPFVCLDLGPISALERSLTELIYHVVQKIFIIWTDLFGLYFTLAPVALAPSPPTCPDVVYSSSSASRYNIDVLELEPAPQHGGSMAVTHKLG